METVGVVYNAHRAQTSNERTKNTEKTKIEERIKARWMYAIAYVVL